MPNLTLVTVVLISRGVGKGWSQRGGVGGRGRAGKRPGQGVAWEGRRIEQLGRGRGSIRAGAVAGGDDQRQGGRGDETSGVDLVVSGVGAANFAAAVAAAAAAAGRAEPSRAQTRGIDSPGDYAERISGE